MNIISLSDSDDDVPLIPTATTSLKRRLPCDKFPAKKTSFFEDSGSSMVLLDPSDEVIDLSSDDDGPSTKDAIHKLPLSTQQKEEVGLLKHTAESCTAPGVSKLAANENLDARSDQTEVYSLSSDTDKPSSEKTEVYSNSDLDSLPEIDLGEPGTAYNPGMRKEIRPDVIIRSSVLPVKDNGENFQPITTNLPDGSLEDIYTNIKVRSYSSPKNIKWVMLRSRVGALPELCPHFKGRQLCIHCSDNEWPFSKRTNIGHSNKYSLNGQKERK